MSGRHTQEPIPSWADEREEDTMCDGVSKRGLGSEPETMCGACGAPVVNNRCSRGAEECWERSQMQKRRDASKGTKLPQLAKAVAVEWRRWHHHPEQQLIHLELIDALHAMAEHIGYPAFGPGGEDLPVEEREAETAAWPQTMRQLADEGPPSIDAAGASTVCSRCEQPLGSLCDRCRRAG